MLKANHKHVKYRALFPRQEHNNIQEPYPEMFRKPLGRSSKKCPESCHCMPLAEQLNAALKL